MPSELEAEIVTAVLDSVADRESTTLHPSGLHGCDRKLLLSAAGAEKSHPNSKELIWKLRRFGTYEELARPGLEKLAAEYTAELRSQVELTLGKWHGYVDFALLGQHGNTYIEVKSSAPSAFGRGSMPYDAHKAQAQAYYVMAHESKVPNAPGEVVILYIARFYDGKIPDVTAYDVTPDEGEYYTLLDEMKLLEKLHDDGIIEPVPFQSPSEHPFLCRRTKNWKTGETEVSCEYYDHCWKNPLPL